MRQSIHLGLYDGKIVNLDFHTAPHFGDKSVLEKHWAGARGKVMKGALCLFAQDADSKLMLYTAADIRRDESDEQVLLFLFFWNTVQRGVKPTLVFDSQFTNYQKLSELNTQKDPVHHPATPRQKISFKKSMTSPYGSASTSPMRRESTPPPRSTSHSSGFVGTRV